MQAGDFGSQIAEILDSAHGVQFGLKRLQPFFVDCGNIHARGVIVADLLGIRIAVGGSRSFLENLPQNRPVSLIEFAEPAPGSFVGRYRIVFQPGSAGVLIEVVARIGLLIDSREIEAGRGFQIAGILRAERRGEQQDRERYAGR